MFKAWKNWGGISTFTINLYDSLVQLLNRCFAFFYAIHYMKEITVAEHAELWEIAAGPETFPPPPKDDFTGEGSSYLLERQLLREKKKAYGGNWLIRIFFYLHLLIFSFF